MPNQFDKNGIQHYLSHVRKTHKYEEFNIL